MDIPISEKYGINPAMTSCPVCGKLGSEIMLAGNSNKWKCDKCGQNHVAYAGSASKMECICGNKYLPDRQFTKIGKFDGSRDKVYAMHPCTKCQAEQDKKDAEVEDAVRAGGIYWRCVDCKSEGALMVQAELSKFVRKRMQIFAPDPAGIAFSKKECPVCGPDKITEDIPEK